MKYVAFCHCYSGTSRIAEPSSREIDKCVREIEIDEGESNAANKLIQGSRKLLVELNKDAKNCFWIIHLVISIQEPKNT